MPQLFSRLTTRRVHFLDDMEGCAFTQDQFAALLLRVRRLDALLEMGLEESSLSEEERLEREFVRSVLAICGSQDV